MIEIAFSSAFRRAFKRRVQGDAMREKMFREKVQQFQNNVFEPSLKTHKLSGKLKDYWSFSVEYDLRIIFYFAGEEKIVFVDIGSHKEVY